MFRTHSIKLISAVATISLAAAAYGSSASGAFEDGSVMAKLSTAGTIRVGIKYDTPLFGLMGLDNTPSGFDVEVAKMIVASLGIREEAIQWVATPTAVREEALKDGKVDFIAATYTMNEKRRQVVTFAGPYYKEEQKIAIRKVDAAKITSIRSFRENPKLKLCAIDGNQTNDNAKEFLADWHKQLVLFDVWSKCGAAMKNGQVDGIVSASGTLLGLSYDAGGSFVLLDDLVVPKFSGNGVGLPKGQIEFCKFIDKQFTKWVSDGGYEAAWKKTVGKFVPAVPPFPEATPCE